MIEVVAALIWDGDRFLICQRSAQKVQSLLWKYVGEKVEVDKTGNHQRLAEGIAR